MSRKSAKLVWTRTIECTPIVLSKYVIVWVDVSPLSDLGTHAIHFEKWDADGSSTSRHIHQANETLSPECNPRRCSSQLRSHLSCLATALPFLVLPVMATEVVKRRFEGRWDVFISSGVEQNVLIVEQNSFGIRMSCNLHFGERFKNAFWLLMHFNNILYVGLHHRINTLIEQFGMTYRPTSVNCLPCTMENVFLAHCRPKSQ
jgi:hypothetical protein